MLDRLLHALIQSRNEAADDVLLDALRLGVEAEQRTALDGLFRRQTVRGLSGVIGRYHALPEPLQLAVLANIKLFHHALRECGRSGDVPLRLAAMKLIALGRQGKLAYVLSENLHQGTEALSKAATEAMVALARWVSLETRRLQRGEGIDVRGSRVEDGKDGPGRSASLDPPSSPYQELLDQRPEIEAAVARAMDVHRGRHGQDLLRAAMLLCDWPGSKTLAILGTARHAGQSPMVRRLQQPPASEHVEAFLLGASHGQLRSHFGTAFAHVNEAPVLDALLRKTHWLKDHSLQLCMHHVSRGAWWDDAELAHDIERRTPDEAARIGEWLAASCASEVVQDDRLERLRQHATEASPAAPAETFPARLRLLRVAAGRKRGASVAPVKAFLADPDERIVRMAARELVRRRPADFENVLLQLLTGAGESVRRVITRAIGQAGFENFWQRFDRLDKPTRRRAGQAMLKILPDAVGRLQRRLVAGPLDQRLKAMQITQELGLAVRMREQLVHLCGDPHPRVRSKAVAVMRDAPEAGDEVLIDRLLNDTDARVRANAVEVLEARGDQHFLPALARRARAANSRERANAIKALARLRVGTVSTQLQAMLRDERPEHRVSAMWVLRAVGWWPLLGEVGRLAKEDVNLRVRRYAVGVLRGVAEMAQAQRAGKAG